MELYRECEGCIHKAVCKFRNNKYDYIPEDRRHNCELFGKSSDEQEKIIKDWSESWQS